ncbi:hypothetical protein CEXT_13371 [Caerostris extrusa]|uniref:Uncharacterized protein n=1 Tax=Caerostris extrusa TaxID=172846 RepID=A0AAV4YCK0_CAEEX|nr:hypothetical protein CEXT_13371 [Caerostris extrusa]
MLSQCNTSHNIAVIKEEKSVSSGILPNRIGSISFDSLDDAINDFPLLSSVWIDLERKEILRIVFDLQIC